MIDISIRQNGSSPAIILLIVIAGIFMLAVAATIGLVVLAGGSAGGTLRSGRSVITHSDSLSLTTTFSRDTATIETAGKLIVVEPGRLLVDGKTIAEISPDSDIEINVKRGVVEFVADGKSIPNIR